jgi:DNA polymerase
VSNLFLDLETYSPIPLDHGLLNYASQAEILLFAFAFDNGPVELWDVASGEPMPSDLFDALHDHTVRLVAHNSQFDRTLLHATGTCSAAPHRWIDTMAQAYAHGLPGGLDKLSEVFGLTSEFAKDKGGRRLIHLFCKPDKEGNRATAASHPKQWAEFCEYAKRDIVAMRKLHYMMPQWNYPKGSDYQVWVVDQIINDRGVAVDLDLARKAVEAAEEQKDSLNKATRAATEEAVQAATQRDAMLKFILEAHGVQLPDMRADTLQRRIEDESLPLALRELLALRVQSSRNASSKYKSVLQLAAADGRLHHTLQYCGAATTGRWSGRKPQFQNQPRPHHSMTPELIADAVEDIKAGRVTCLYPDVPRILGDCVRGVIVAPKKRKLIACDLSSIEGRMLAWLAGEQFVVDFYRDVDMKRVTYDSYMLAYAMCFGVDPASVVKSQRTIGKPIELAHGYGGGCAAFLNFAMVYHLDLDKVAEAVWASGDKALLGDCHDKYTWAQERGFHAGLPQFQYAAFEYIKTKWRTARPKTVEFWKDLAKAFENAVNSENQIFLAGKIKFLRTGQWLRLQLPSGRQLCFLQPRADSKGLSYMGLNRYSRRWQRCSTHGGKLSGLVTQAAASDILRASLPKLEENGYETVLTVHDEVICETPDSDKFTAAHVAELMTEELPWSRGLPMTADGFETYRYRKLD